MDTRSIRELRNLGPACESDLHAVGIYSVDAIAQLGIETTMIKVIENRMARRNGQFTINATYLYALYGAVHDCDWREIPEEKKIEFKKLAASLRKQYSLRKPQP